MVAKEEGFQVVMGGRKGGGLCVDCVIKGDEVREECSCQVIVGVEGCPEG